MGELKVFKEQKELSETKKELTVSVRERLVCLTGEKRGKAYPLKIDRVVIGRSPHCHITVDDKKASREHVEIVRIKNNFIISDLGSQNGIFVNGKKVKQQQLAAGDKFSVGETVYEFKTGHSQPASHQKVKTPEKNEKSRKLIFVIFAVGVIFLLFLIPEESVEKNDMAVEKNEQSYDLTEINPELMKKIQKKKISEDKELNKQVEAIIKRGLRELREENYFRAISEFQHAKSLDQNNSQANFYLRKTNDELDDVIKKYNMSALREIEALGYRKAIVSYCAIIRLLHNYPEDERYQAAELNIKKLEQILGLESGEVQCLQK